MYAITAACSKVLWKALVKSGVDPDSLAIPAQEIEATLASGAPIRTAVIYGLFDEALRQTGNPDLGLLAYHYAHPSVWSPFTYSIMSAPTLGNALERVVEYHPLISSGSQLFLDRDSAGNLVLHGRELGQLSAPRAFLDAGAALVLALIHWLEPYHRPMPIRVEFTYPEPENTARLARLFGPDLVFSARTNALVFCPSIAELPLPTADEALDALHAERAQHMAHEILNGSVAARVRRLLMELIAAQARPTLPDIAERLGLSPRSLQNALDREDTHFKAIADDCRLRLAHDYLRRSTRSIKYIATTLGFNDQSSFHKACLRWFGMSPNRYRADLG